MARIFFLDQGIAIVVVCAEEKGWGKVGGTMRKVGGGGRVGRFVN